MEHNQKVWENVIIVVLIAIVACLLWPIIQTIFFDSKFSSAQNNTENAIDMVELLYTRASMDQEIPFPFVVTFKDGDYTAYAGSETNIINTKIDHDGKLPDSGHVILSSDGLINAIDLTYDDIICNKFKEQPLECVKNS